MQLQLSQPLAAKYSTKVAQKGQKNGSICPQLLNGRGLPVNIDHHTGRGRLTDL
jgi:hypothetical protein